MHDGTIRVLTYIRYALEMQKNFILLGVMIGKDLHIILAEWGLKVTKDTLVMMKGIWKRNLFYLYSRIIVDGDVVVLHILGTNDTSLLWYMQLGNIGEGILQTLVK